MKDAPLPETALGMLRTALAEAKTDKDIKLMIESQAGVLERYQPIFAPENLEELTADEFQGFLRFNNNHHWSMLAFYGPRMCSDMPKLRGALRILLEESKPLVMRLDQLVPKRKPTMVHGLNRATISAILLVTHPDKYGVWNQTTETAMHQVGLWPAFEKGASFGQRYAIVNDILVRTARDLDSDLWTLDALWWWLLPEKPENLRSRGLRDSAGAEDRFGSDVTFGPERYLHDFLRDNWTKTSLGREWNLYTKDGEEVGYEFPCAVGKIDLLARHHKEKTWLVIELKRGQGSDDTVGQVLRYMGWVKENLAEPGDTVEGLIIAHGRDEKIRYALKVARGVRLMLYEVDFRLVPDTTN